MKPATAAAQLLISAALIGLALAVALSTTLTLAAGYVPLMFWDQWETASMYAELEAGTWQLNDWWKLHNEHRILFPRLVYLADLAWAGGSDVINLMSLMLVQLSHGYLLFRLVMKASPLPNPLRLAVGLAFMAATIALIQVGNLRWGFQVAFVGVYAAASGAIALTVRADKSGVGVLAAAIALALVATFCMANGLLIWPIMVWAAVLAGAGRKSIVSIAAAGVAAFAAYLVGYETPAHHAPPLASLQQPDQLILYLVTYLGNPLQSLGHGVAKTLGALALAYVLAVSIQLWRERQPMHARLALAAIALFVVLSGAMTAVGRIGFGVDQALEGRYATPAIIFWLTTIGLLITHSRPAPIFAVATALASGALVVAVATAQVSAYEDRYDYLRTKAPAFTALASGVEDEKAIGRVSSIAWPNLQPRVKGLHRLDKKPFSGMPGKLVGQRLDDIIEMPLTDCEGEVTSVSALPAGETQLTAFGWAWDSESASTPTWILLVDPKTRTVAGLGRSGFPRPHVPRHFDHIQDGNTGWYGHAIGDRKMLLAFGLLADGRAACRLKPFVGGRAVSPAMGPGTPGAPAPGRFSQLSSSRNTSLSPSSSPMSVFLLMMSAS